MLQKKLKLEREKIGVIMRKWQNFVEGIRKIRESQALMEKRFNMRVSNTFLEIQEEPKLELKRSQSK